MSGPTLEKARNIGPPPRWLKCPRHGQVIDGKFVPLKTPLCDFYDDQVPEIYRYYVSMVFGVSRNSNSKIGLWIDLTNTDRFYRREEVEKCGANYVKLNCKGHSECPNEEQTLLFINICKKFWKENPGSLVAVHCTHGFNRTGFLIISYLVMEKDWSVDAAVQAFAAARSPGIYKEDYLRELFRRFDNVDDTPLAPALPDWCNDTDPILDDNEAEANSSNRPSTSSKKGVSPFVEGVPEIKLVGEQSKSKKLQKLVQDYCDWKKQGFPGSQPVSMEMDNLNYLQQKLYQVTWKADGVRYMMLINGENEVYMFDRDHNVYKVPNVRFPHRKENRHIKGTLVDGELIFDEVAGKKVARYLIYDIVRFEEKPVGQCDFGLRKICVMREIIEPRHHAIKQGLINPDLEPIRIRAKEFWDVTQVEKLLSDHFAATVPHEIDGLVFQPFKDPYEPGRCQSVLKWKPHYLNSVDFKLQIVREHKEGMLPELIGHLYVLHLDRPFDTIKMTKELKQYDKKIIECTYEKDKGWKFLRERRDKSYPNAYTTAVGVCKSITNPITKEYLIDFVKTKAQHPPNKAKQQPPVTNGVAPTASSSSKNGSASLALPTKKRPHDDDDETPEPMLPPVYVPPTKRSKE